MKIKLICKYCGKEYQESIWAYLDAMFVSFGTAKGVCNSCSKYYKEVGNKW